MKPQILFSVLALLTGAAHAETGYPEEIPESGRIRVDGELDDWKRADWVPLDQTLDGHPVNVSNAEWALQWNDDGWLYIAVRYEDADLVLQDRYVHSNAQDCVEIYVRGDTDSQPLDYSKTQDSAQRYIFGLSKNKTVAWKKLAELDRIPSHNSAEVAIQLAGKTFTYEIRVPLYDRFNINTRRHSRMSELEVDSEIGADIAIVDFGATGYAGMKSGNTLKNKAHNADQIAEHTLGE